MGILPTTHTHQVMIPIPQSTPEDQAASLRYFFHTSVHAYLQRPLSLLWTVQFVAAVAGLFIPTGNVYALYGLALWSLLVVTLTLSAIARWNNKQRAFWEAVCIPPKP